MGPTDYDPKKITKRFPTTVIRDEIIPEPAIGNVRDQMEFYLNKIFEPKGKPLPKKQSIPVDFH